MHTVDKLKTKEFQMPLLRDEIFIPDIKDNASSTDLVKQSVSIPVEAFLQELRDTKKATHKYLSSSGSPFLYEHCPEGINMDMLGKMATSNCAESSFAGVTNQSQQFSRISVPAAAAVNNIKRNQILIYDRIKGLFHDFPVEIQSALMVVVTEDASATAKGNKEGLDVRQEAKRKKATALKQMGIEKATEEYIDGIYYFNMYKSMACWKSARDVSVGLKSLVAKKDRYGSIKKIRIKVKGFG